MTDKPARCPNPSCGSDMVNVSYNSELEALKVTCRMCDAASGWHKTTGNALAAWAKMGAWRNGGWRDIATAPRDGTRIYVAKLDDTFGWVRGISRWVDFKGISGWVSMGLYDPPGDLGLARPTHWLPLPEPPKEEP